jgi:hypothetical protein
MIDITGVDLVEFIKRVYEMSRPVGMGMLQFTPEPLTDEEAKSIINHDSKVIVSMDYVRGRQCKIGVIQQDGKLYAEDPWHDHSDDEYRVLLESFGIEYEGGKEHRPACCCFDCQVGRL